MKVGGRIKNLRLDRRVTLKKLAEKTGLTASFLSQLERDIVSASIDSLERISRALNTRVGYFFQEIEQKGLVFIKKGTGSKTIDKQRNFVSETLPCGLLNIKMEPFIFTLCAGGELRKKMFYPSGERFGMMLKGKIEISCDGKKMILGEGDSIYCTHHKVFQRIKNIGQTQAKFLWIVFTDL